MTSRDHPFYIPKEYLVSHNFHRIQSNLREVIHITNEYLERYPPPSKTQKIDRFLLLIVDFYHIEVSISTRPIGNAGKWIGDK